MLYIPEMKDNLVNKDNPGFVAYVPVFSGDCEMWFYTDISVEIGLVLGFTLEEVGSDVV